MPKPIPMTKAVYAKLLKRNQELQAENDRMKFDPAFGGLTQAGLEVEHRKYAGECQYVVFVDLNNIHNMNDELGHAVVDEKIRKAFSFALREGDLVFYGRRYSGDEEAFILRGNPEGFIVRLLDNLHANGLDGVADHAKIKDNDLFAACKEASNKVYATKKTMKEEKRV